MPTGNGSTSSSWDAPPHPFSVAVGYVLRGAILVYRYGISPMFPPTCRYSPSCSRYGLEAITKYGAFRGGWMTVRRIFRCHPGHPGGYDPVP